MRKPIKEVTVQADGSKMTLDFDTVQGMTPHKIKLRGESFTDKMIEIEVTVVRFKDKTELALLDKYEEMRDWWIWFNEKATDWQTPDIAVAGSQS